MLRVLGAAQKDADPESSGGTSAHEREAEELEGGPGTPGSSPAGRDCSSQRGNPEKETVFRKTKTLRVH